MDTTKTLRNIVLFALVLTTTSIVSIAQNIGGIGAVLKLDTLADGYTLPKIQSVVPNSPAAQSLKDGLYILTVDGIDCKNTRLDLIVGMIRGEIGSKIKLSTTDDPKSKHEKKYELVRAAIQANDGNTKAIDPVDAFLAGCEQEVKSLKKAGHTIVKTYNSECGNYFFNFDAEKDSFHVRLYTAEIKPSGAYNKGFEAEAKVFDSNNETVFISLKATGTQDKGNAIVTVSEGTMAFSKECVGVVNVQIKPLTDAGRCKAMFIVVYK